MLSLGNMDLGYMCLQTLYCWIMKADSWWIVLCVETVNWAASEYNRLLRVQHSPSRPEGASTFKLTTAKFWNVLYNEYRNYLVSDILTHCFWLLHFLESHFYHYWNFYSLDTLPNKVYCKRWKEILFIQNKNLQRKL